MKQAKTQLAELSDKRDRERARAQETEKRNLARQKEVASEIKVGDRVNVAGILGWQVPALVLEVRPPLVNVQWADGITVMEQTTRWVRMENIAEIRSD